MRTEDKLVPNDAQVEFSTSNVRLDTDAVFSDTFHQLAVEILKTHIIYNPLTLTATLDNQWFEVGADLLRTVLKLIPPKQYQQITTPPDTKTLVHFVKELRYTDPDTTIKTISKAVVAKYPQPWRTIISILNKCLTGKDSGLDKVRHTMMQITTRRTRLTKSDKLPFPRFTKLIIAHIMSKNNTINQRSNATVYRSDLDERYKPAKVAKGVVIYYGLPIPDTMLNDTIREMNAYKEAEGVRKIGMGKGPMKRGDGGVLEPAAEQSTKIVLKRNTVSNDKQVKKKPVRETPVKGKRLKSTSKMTNETYVKDPEELLMDFEKTCNLSRKEALIQELSRGQAEGSRTKIQTLEQRDSLDSDRTLSATRLDVMDEGDKDDASNFTVPVHEKTLVSREKRTPILTTISSPRTHSSQDNISRYLNENPAPSFEDVGLPRAVGASGLRSYDGSSGKEKPKGNSVDPHRLPEPQTVVVPEVTMTEPTGLDQRCSIGVDSVLITPDETLTLETIPRGNLEVTSCTSGASEIPPDVLA
ncbi:hypothetical protein Tco_0857896 [Tanacetum coccineum]|uniref:Uncharacterized protein n=1 Tax=Tanacetum coccineum TaxID=301880 RepID=A0ABQ5BD97_9ASTR